MFKRSSRAFTLVELLVVVGIIAILLAILLPSLNKAREQAKAIQCASNTRQIAMAFIQYATDNKGVLPASYRSGLANTPVNAGHWWYLAIAMPSLLDRKYLPTTDVRDVPQWDDPGFAGAPGPLRVRYSPVLTCPSAQPYIGLGFGAWVSSPGPGGVGSVTGWVFRVAGADEFSAEPFYVIDAGYVPSADRGIYTHYSINGSWGWEVETRNLRNRLAFSIAQDSGWQDWMPNFREKQAKLNSRGGSKQWMLGDGGRSDWGLRRPVFRHGPVNNPSANFAYMDGHVELIPAKSVGHDLLGADLWVNDSRLWKFAPGPGY